MIRENFKIKNWLWIIIIIGCWLTVGRTLAFASSVEDDIESKMMVETESEFFAEYEAIKSSMFSNIQDFGALTPGALPCVGKPKILVFYTTFTGGEQNWGMDKGTVEKYFFDRSQNAQSLSNYYYTSSYGKVEIVGDVYEYTTQYDTGHYNDVGQVLDEIVEHYKKKIKWDDYDSNKDGYVDGVYVIARTKHSWGGPNFVGEISKDLGNVSICKACFLDSQDLNTICHETCHMFGPADMYAGMGLNPSGTKTDTIMDQSGLGGDLPGITKFVLGWIDNPNFIKGTGTFELTLDSYSTNSEIAIIFPNGDSANENWMVMEYLTPEGNNYYKGVRIWKTCMNLDENYNIRGSSEFSSGMPSSPYEYLVTVYPNEVGNYYYGAGESLTPYTNPSTCYGKSYKRVGNAKHIDEVGFSGIYININSINEKSASVTITINNDTEDIAVSANVLYGFSRGAFIDDSNRLMIATVTSELEMNVVDEVVMTELSTGTLFNVEASQTSDKKTIFLYIKKDDVLKLKANTKYKINLQTALKSYAGASITFPQFDGVISFGNIPIPYNQTELYPNGTSVYQDNYDLKYFKTGQNAVSTVFYENNTLWLGTIDISKKTTSVVKLKTDVNKNIQSVSKTWIVDQKYFLVALENEYQVVYLGLYDFSGNMLDARQLDSEYYFGHIPYNKILNHGETYYEIVVQNKKIKLQTITLPPGVTWYEGYYDINDKYYAKEKRVDNDKYTFTVVNYKTAKEVYIGESYEELMYTKYHNNQYYIVYLDVTGDFKLKIYNTAFELKEEVDLLKSPGFKYMNGMDLGFTESGYYVKFDAVASTNDVNYVATFLLKYDNNHKLINYYRYGDSTNSFVGDIVYIGNNRFLLGTKDSYCILNLDYVTADTSLPFIDVYRSKWFFSAVKWTYENGLLTGTSDTEFSPNDPMTRGMLVTVLYRMEGRPSISANTKFADVISSKYYAKAIAWASSQNIVSGYSNGKFGPEDSITREQLAKVLYLYADYKGYDVTAKESLSAFNDASNVSSYAKKYMQWAVAEGLIKGSNGKLKPKGEATRAEIAAILKRFVERYQ